MSARATETQKPGKDMCGGTVYFLSRRKVYGLLSNLAAAKVKDQYPSSEHAMCALRGPPEFRYLLKIGGALDGDQKRFEAFVQARCPEKSNHKTFAIKWKSWKGYPGIIAKMIMGAGKEAQRRRLYLGIAIDGVRIFPKEEWIDLLRDKFTKNQAHRDVLMQTEGKTLVEFDRLATKRGSKWGGCIKDGELYGQNLMGEYIMEVRNLLK